MRIFSYSYFFNYSQFFLPPSVFVFLLVSVYLLLVLSFIIFFSSFFPSFCPCLYLNNLSFAPCLLASTSQYFLSLKIGVTYTHPVSTHPPPLALPSLLTIFHLSNLALCSNQQQLVAPFYNPLDSVFIA